MSELQLAVAGVGALGLFIALLAGIKLVKRKLWKELGLLRRHLAYHPPPPPTGYTME